jgi:hypothetical protein
VLCDCVLKKEQQVAASCESREAGGLGTQNPVPLVCCLSCMLSVVCCTCELRVAMAVLCAVLATWGLGVGRPGL